MTTNPELAPDMPDPYFEVIKLLKKHIKPKCYRATDDPNHYPSIPEVDFCTAARSVINLIRADLAPQAGSVDVEGLRKELRKISDQTENSGGWHFVDKIIDHLASRNLLAGAPVGGDERPAIPGLQEAIERREKLLATKRTLGHENRGIHTEGDPIFEAAKLYASCQSGVPDGWQLIETAPRDGTTVLLFSNKNGLGWNITGYGRWEGGDDIVSGWVSFGMIEPGGNLGLANPTHWMPLPAAPRDGRD